MTTVEAEESWGEGFQRLDNHLSVPSKAEGNEKST